MVPYNLLRQMHYDFWHRCVTAHLCGSLFYVDCEDWDGAYCAGGEL